MDSELNKWCAVSQCNNKSTTTPNKLFIKVPSDENQRHEWFKLARSNVPLTSSIYFCEDHFDMPNDMENYIQYLVKGSMSQVQMRPECAPTKFECQRRGECFDSEEINYPASSAADKVKAMTSWEPGQQAPPPPELAAVKQEVDIEELDPLQHPEDMNAVNYDMTTECEGVRLSPIERSRTEDPQIISERNIKTEPDSLSVDGSRNKTDDDSLSNEGFFVRQRASTAAEDARDACLQAWEAHTTLKRGEEITQAIRSEYLVPIVQLMSDEEDAAAQVNATVEASAGEDSARGSADSCLLRCGHCAYSCAAEDQLRRHSRLHDPARPHECNVCHYRFFNITILNNHLKMHTGFKPYRCNLCGYECLRNHNLITHMRRHTKEKPFQCDLCENRFSLRNHLNRHKIRKHTDEKPFTCSLCEYKSSQKESLTDHMRRHTNEKPFKCNVCDYRCAQRNTLNYHKLSRHSIEKPFKCDLCDYKCFHKESLNRHMRRHTQEKPFKCDQCDYKGSQKQNLIRHMKQHTKQKPFVFIEVPNEKVKRVRHSLRKHNKNKHLSVDGADSSEDNTPRALNASDAIQENSESEKNSSEKVI